MNEDQEKKSNIFFENIDKDTRVRVIYIFLYANNRTNKYVKKYIEMPASTTIGSINPEAGIVGSGVWYNLLVLGLAVPDLRRDLPLAEPTAVQKLHTSLRFCRLSECDLRYSFGMPLRKRKDIKALRGARIASMRRSF